MYLAEKTARPEFRRYRQRTGPRAWFWPFWEDVPVASFEEAYHMNRCVERLDDAGLQDVLGRLQLWFRNRLWAAPPSGPTRRVPIL